jgi:hypothetical protein
MMPERQNRELEERTVARERYFFSFFCNSILFAICTSTFSKLCKYVEMEILLSQCLLSLMYLISLSVSSCVDPPFFYATLVQLLFNSG